MLMVCYDLGANAFQHTRRFQREKKFSRGGFEPPT